MPNPQNFYEQEFAAPSQYEQPCADPEIFRNVGTDGRAWVYEDMKHDLLTVLRPEFWRKCVSHGARRGHLIELRLGAPEELKIRRVCICEIDKSAGTFKLSLEDNQGNYKIVTFPKESAKAA